MYNYKQQIISQTCAGLTLEAKDAIWLKNK
jgi:hypothetical protein